MKTPIALAFSVCLTALIALSALAAQGPAPAAGAGQGAGRAAALAPPPPQAGHPSGKLVIWGDLAFFDRPNNPDNCVLTNRFKKGQRVGFRMTAIDGGSGEVENTAVIVAHLSLSGKTIDVPLRFRGFGGATAPTPRGYLRPTTELFTGFWLVPDDAPTGIINYTVTATDRFGRTASFTPFSYELSQLTIVG
jgi:hypothetical protein